MKMIRRILPDLLALAGAVCIGWALFLVSPALGLAGAGAAFIAAAVLLSLFGGEDK